MTTKTLIFRPEKPGEKINVLVSTNLLREKGKTDPVKPVKSKGA